MNEEWAPTDDLTIEQQENCRRISEWINPDPHKDFPAEGWHSFWRPVGPHVYKPLNFYRDEAANALVLEKMAKENAYVWVEWDISDWGVMWKKTATEVDDCSPEFSHSDRKTAVVLAAIALIDKGARE